MVLLVSASLVMWGCGTYEGQGAYAGSTLGAIFGSAVGGLTGGARGADIGELVGMVGGAAIGGSIGKKADQLREKELGQFHHDVRERRRGQRRDEQARQRENREDSPSQDDVCQGESPKSYEDYGKEQSGFDETNSGDDRIYDFTGQDYTGNYSAKEPDVKMPRSSKGYDIPEHLTYTPAIEIRNARFVDGNQDNVISRNEISKVIFEVYNRDKEPIYDIQPVVVETTKNKHVFISPSVHIEKILPNRGIRYTAIVKADERLKKGKVRIVATVLQGNQKISKVCEFNIPTVK